MHRFSKKTAYWVLGLLLFAGFSALWLVSPPWSREGNMVVLSGNTPAALNQAQFVNHSNPTQEIEVILGLDVRDEAKLDALIAAQADPKSPEFRKFITPAEFKQRFSPAQADVDKVVAYLQTNGLTVLSVSDNNLLIHVKGSVDEFEKAFKVRINVYRLHSKTHLSNDRDPSVPAELRGVVRAVIGLNTFAEYEPRHVRNTQAQNQLQPRAARPVGFGADEIAKVYKYPNQNNPAATKKYDGTGVTVAIATAYGYDPKDVELYWKTYGIKRTGKITDIPVNGKTKQLEGETTLDLQQLGAQAPGADILMYIGKDPKFTTFTKIFNEIVNDNKASVVSISWGLCEDNTGAAQMYPEHISFKQGAAQGIAFFAAAGDDGAYDCGDGKTLAVDYPSSDPYVTAVGGTTLELNSDGSRKSEKAWTGGGGGVSGHYARESWQTGKGVPAGDKRVSADLSLVSDPATGYSMYFQGNWESAGGTSFAAPAWAALWALGNEAAGQRLGPANPTVYRLGQTADYAKTFVDINKGDNGNNQGPGYNAASDWDHPTGWGVPNGDALIDWLVNDKATPATPATPTQGTDGKK